MNSLLLLATAKSRRHHLTATPVKYEALASTKATIIFVPEGLDAMQLDTVFSIAKVRKLAIISTSDHCLIVQKCAISITSNPAVDIKISVAAAAATGVSFGSTFRMMIKEVQ